MTTHDPIPKKVPAQVVGYQLGINWRTLVKWAKDPGHDFPRVYRYANAWWFDEEAVLQWSERQVRVGGPDISKIRTP